MFSIYIIVIISIWNQIIILQFVSQHGIFFLIENFWTINYFWNYASLIPKVLKCSNFKKNIIFPWGKSSFRSLSSCINLEIACPQLWPGISCDHLSWCSYLSPAYHGAWFYCFLVYLLILQDKKEVLWSANAFIQLSHLIHSKSFAPLSSDCNVLGCVCWLSSFWSFEYSFLSDHDGGWVGLPFYSDNSCLQFWEIVFF